MVEKSASGVDGNFSLLGDVTIKAQSELNVGFVSFSANSRFSHCLLPSFLFRYYANRSVDEHIHLFLLSDRHTDVITRSRAGEVAHKNAAFFK